MQASLEDMIKTAGSPMDLESSAKVRPIHDYADILKALGVKYKRKGYYLEVGVPQWVQGWILDISVIQSQLQILLESVIPLLVREDVPFKIVTSSRKAHSILSGELGLFMLGKLLSIYPQDENRLVELANKLMHETSNFKGPEIVAARKLGGVIYTRYGAGKPILRVNDFGIEEQYIYNVSGELVNENRTIPFQLPEGIRWPFDSIAPPERVKRDTVLQDRYKPMYMLKEDPKGTVRKGLWLKKIYQIKWCVIKEGRQNMVSDLEGRDVVDRLRWQNELHKDLQGVVPLPAIYDLFEENGDGYLVMQYIRGIALHKRIESGFKDNVWANLQLAERLCLLDYTLQILNIIETMHAKGYIHRDITTNNFLVNKKDQLWMIDLELTYSMSSKKPFPPFRLGTPGFMSPEQEATMVPTKEQDIYAIGAVLVEILTGLPPDHFVQENELIAKQQLGLFINDPELIDLVGDCFSIDPKLRPAIPTLRRGIDKFRQRQTEAGGSMVVTPHTAPPEKENLKVFIGRAVAGLAGPELVNVHKLWVSKSSGKDGSDPLQAKPMAVYESLFDGVAGVIWLLSRAHGLGLPIDDCKESYGKGLEFIRNNLNKTSGSLPAGLYFGTSGIAMAVAAGIGSGLITNDSGVTSDIMSWLENKNTQGVGIVRGLAGQGMALLQSVSFLDANLIRPILLEKVARLLDRQEDDGSWTAETDRNKNLIKPTGFGHGVAGIACFLLCYLQQWEDDALVRQSVSRAMQWLARQAYKKRGLTRWSINSKSKQSVMNFQDGCWGIVLSLIKAYKILGESEYRKLAEDCLLNYPSHAVNSDLTLETGLAGYGEVFLEAAKIFGSGQWQQQADWIAQFLLHYFKQEKEGVYYWVAKGAYPTAELLGGNSGVIHFLLRYYQPDSLSHPLLSC